MRSKLLQNGLVKGLLVAFVCCVLLGSGVFSGKALAGDPSGGSYEVFNRNNGSVLMYSGPIETMHAGITSYIKETYSSVTDEEASRDATEITNKAKGVTTGVTTGTMRTSGQFIFHVHCIKSYLDDAGGGETPSAASLKDSIVALNTAYLMSINNLTKRMGDLRGGEASNIPWVRFSRNNNTMGATGYNGNTYQVGYDREIARDKNSRQLLGISLDINDGTTKLTNGSGKMQGFSVGLYYTKIYESGHYFDFIFRQGRLSDDVKTFYADATNPYTAFDYDINATTLSGEYGYRWKLGKSGFYLEPQAELIYGYLSSANITTNNNESLKLESNNKFISRMGLAFGKRRNNFNYYARVSQFRDWGSAKSTVIQDGTASSVDLAKNWWEVSLGGGWHMSDISYFYAEISKQYKDIQNSLNFNLGFRLSL